MPPFIVAPAVIVPSLMPLQLTGVLADPLIDKITGSNIIISSVSVLLPESVAVKV